MTKRKKNGLIAAGVALVIAIIIALVYSSSHAVQPKTVESTPKTWSDTMTTSIVQIANDSVGLAGASAQVETQHDQVEVAPEATSTDEPVQVQPQVQVETKAQSKPQQSNPPATAPQQETAPEPAPTPEPQPAPAPTQSARSVAQGYVGSSASSLAGAVGAPSSKSYASSCMGDGEDGIWYYADFTVYTYRAPDGAETVQAVE